MAHPLSTDIIPYTKPTNLLRDAAGDMSSSDEVLLVQELPMDMHSDDGAGEHRLAHVLPPLACAPGRPPFRPPPPPSAAAAAEFRVAFRGWLGAPRHWELWVAKVRPIHERLWRELGIFDAVLASTYRFKRDASAVLHLASFWSPGTNTFAFPWGEATLTLEDVAVLGGFPTDGSPVPAPLPPQWGSDEAALNGVRLGLNRSACKKAHHAAWIKHFLTDTGTDTDTVIEHAAFLALWLTRFVLPGHPESTMRQSLFPLAVRMARGDRIALGPAVLASLYRDLREMKTYLLAAGTTGGNAELLSPLSVYAPLYILQLWIWERFPILCDGKANPIKDGEPWAARWHDVNKKINPTMIREVLSSGKNFMWKPYPSCQQACKHHSGWVRRSDVTENRELISLAHCLRACELVGADCIEQYLPHRVAMQFGLDQDVPGDVHRANEDWEVAWETYDFDGKNVAIFIPHSEPGVTARFAQWWRQPLPSSDLDVGTGSISVEGKVSKRKVKKTLAAMEAEAEKERKMKKARISSNNDKKRKLEELYDAKLSDWLATARNGSSGTGGGPGGSCKRGSSPKYDDGSDNSLLASVGAGNDDIVLLAPRKQASTPSVNLKDRDMNLDRGGKSLTGSKYEGVNLKGYMASDVYHPVNEPYFKEEEVVSTEIFTINEDAKGEWSNEILKNANELAREETPDVPNSPDEFKPPLCTVNEECSDHLSEVDCSEDGREEDVHVDKPTIFSSAPEGGNDVMQEEKMVNLPEDKCLHATNTPEEGADVTQELEKANLVVDESCVISNRSEEVTALVMEEIEEKGTVTVDNEGTVVSEGVRTAGTSRSIEGIPGSKQGVYTGIMNIPQEVVALAEEIRPVQQTNYVGECVGMSCIMEDTNFAAEVWGTNDGETTLDFVSKEKREISCIEEIGGEESKQMAEKDIKQKPEEAPQVDVVECGEDIALVEKDSEGENQNVAQVLENVVTDNNMAAVLSGFPEERSADEDKALNLAKKDAEDMHKEVVEVGDAKQVRINTLANVGAKEGHNEVAEVEHIDMTEANVHAQFDIEKPKEAAEVGHADMYDCKRSTGRDTDREPGDAPEVAHAEVEKARERIENNKDDKLVEFPDVAHAEMEEAVNLMNEYVDEKFEEVFDLENIRTGGTHGPMEEGTDGKLNEVSDIAQPETNDMKGFIKDDADGKFQEISGFGSIEMDRNYGPMEKDTDGKLNEVSDVAHPETKDMKDFITDYADDKFQEISEFESIRMDETHGPMEEDTDGKLKGVPEVSAEVEQANGTESDNDTPDCILQEDLPARGETRCLVEEDIEEDITNVPQVKHVNIEDEAPVEKDSKENPNADGKDSPEKEVDESKEVYQVKQTEGEEYKVLREKNTEEDTKDALGVKQAEEQQGETLAAEYMHDYIKEVTVVEHVDGQSEKLAKIGAEENPEEIARTHGKEFDNDTTESLKNLVDSEILFSSASIESNEEQKEVSVENMPEKQYLQDVDLINERESFSDGAAMEIQGADDLKTLDMHNEVSIKQIHEHGMISENKTQILEDSHIVGSRSDDLVVMEVDEAWSTVGTHNQEAVNLDKQQTIEGRLNLGTTIKNNKMTMPGHAIMPGCSEFQTDSPETKINLVMPTEGIQNQEDSLIKEELALEKGMECKITEGNGRPLVVTNILGGSGVDTTVVTVDVNNANCVEGIQNQKACSTEEARQDNQHAGAGDVRILEDTSTNYICDAGAEKDLCIEKDPAVLEKQDEGMTYENTERTLVDIDTHESGEVKHDGTMKMIHETDSRVQAVNMTEDKISFKNKQKGVPLGEPSKSDVEDSGSSKKHDSCSEFQTDSRETKINEIMSTEGIHNQEDSLTKEEPALENGLERKITEGNGRPLVVTNILGGGGVDTTVVTVDVNDANCVEGIQNQEACSTELQARQDKQHTGAGDVRILEDTSTNYIVDAGTEKDLCLEKDPAVLEKQDQGMTYENTERTLVNIDAHESGEVKHDGTMKMIHETDSRVQAVNMTNDKIAFKNKQKGVPLGEHSKSDVEDSRSSKKHDGCSEFQTDSPETKINEVMSTEGIQNQEESLTKEEPALENVLERKFTEGNGRPLVVTKIVCGGGVDTTVVTVDVNKANCVEGIQNQEACGTEELQARQDKQHTGAGDVRISEDMSTNCIGDAGEKDLCMEKVLVGSDESCRQDPAVLEKQDEGTTDENTERTLVDIDAPESDEVKHDGAMKMIHETDSRVQAVNMAEDTISFKNKQKGVPLGDHNKLDVECSGSNQTARKEFKGALRPDFEHEVEVKQEILEDKTEISVGRKNDEASEQDQTSTEDATIAPSGMDRGENNNEQTEEPVKGYAKYASDPVNTGCQTSNFGRPSIEEDRRIHSVRSVYLKDIKDSQGRIHSEPSNRTHINNAGYSSRHGVQEPVIVSKDIRVPLHDTVSVCGRDRALELVTGPPEETPRWRQEQHALNILEDVQNARIAEKTRMEMEIRILKAQIVSMQKQVMNMDHAGEVISRSKRH